MHMHAVLISIVLMVGRPGLFPGPGRPQDFLHDTGLHTQQGLMCKTLGELDWGNIGHSIVSNHGVISRYLPHTILINAILIVVRVS